MRKQQRAKTRHRRTGAPPRTCEGQQRLFASSDDRVERLLAPIVAQARRPAVGS